MPHPRPDAAALKDLLVDCGAVRFGEFTLASGRTSSYYVDIKRASTRPDVLRAIARAAAPHVEGYDRVAGMELGAVPIATAVSLEADVPFLVVRKAAKGHGTGGRLEGAHDAGDRVLVVEDVTTTGGSSVEAVEVLRAAGLEVDRCVTVVDREEGADKAFADAGVTLAPLVRASELTEDHS